MPEIWLIALFFIIAMLYSSVGFGGGSSYTAVLAWLGIDVHLIRMTSLLCNITVVGGNTWRFALAKLVPWRKVLPLVSVSIPAAFAGGLLKMDGQLLLIILAGALIVAGLLSVIRFKDFDMPNFSTGTEYSLTLSAGLIAGFLAGLVGIGGGIFLAPILLLIKWDTPKRIAAAASLFILVNSASGLLGQLVQGTWDFNWKFILPLAIAVFIGGQIGVRMTIKSISPKIVKVIAGLLIIFVGLRILWTELG